MSSQNRLHSLIPEAWQKLLGEELDRDYFVKLEAFLDKEWQNQTIFPPAKDIFSALALTPPSSVKVLLLGQDPYHDDNQAHGLCFSVRKGVKHPPSLRNIFKELHSDLNIEIPENGFLEEWAKQGVLMLNTVLTVRAHQANSHKQQGWEFFTDAIIKLVNSQELPVVFLLWGAPANRKLQLIDREKHHVISSVHPSPLSAYRGFFGSRPFSGVNRALEELGHSPIDWNIP